MEKRPQFGQRFLTDDAEVFAHNAWDMVDWGEEQEVAAQDTVSKNSCRPSEDVYQDVLNNSAEKWDKFYGIHNNKFFKDRHWLFTEFPELKETSENVERVNIFEVGCGAGNTIFPIIEHSDENANIFVYGCDFSSTAVDIVKSSKLYSDDKCHAFVCDISQKSLQVPIPEESLDLITMIFVLSALNPDDMAHCIQNLSKYLKPGGHILFRDYGRYDLAQLRFKNGRCLSDNFYARGDGTKVYFFTQDEMDKLFTDAGLEKVQNIVDRRLQVNRARKLKMYRVWIQCKYAKPIAIVTKSAEINLS